MARDRRPYYAADPAWWPSIMGALPRPLTVESVLHDLRYLENQGRRGEVFPSLAGLRARWGWSRRLTAQALEGQLGDWHDPHHPVSLSTLRLVGRPANRLGIGMSTLACKLACKLAVTLETDEAGISDESVHASGNASGKGGGNAASRKPTKEGDPSTTNQINQINQKDPSDPIVELVKLDDHKAELARMKRAAALRVFDHWHTHHPRAGEVPDDADRDRIVKALQRRAKVIKGRRARYTPMDWQIAEQDLRDLCDWFHTAPGAAHWQGANKQRRKYLGISSLYKADKFGDRIADMVAWRDGGSVISDSLGVQDFEPEAIKAWAHLQGLLRHRELPSPLHPHADKALAFRQAIDDVGLIRIRQASPKTMQVLRTAFSAAYCQARANPSTATINTNTGTTTND